MIYINFQIRHIKFLESKLPFSIYLKLLLRKFLSNLFISIKGLLEIQLICFQLSVRLLEQYNLFIC